MITCRACGIVYDLPAENHFYKDKSRSNGLSRRCKACDNKRPKSGKIRSPEKYRARYITNNAIASGKIQKGACERCGNPRVHAHHDDYSKPLAIRWLCPPCHIKHHKENPNVPA